MTRELYIQHYDLPPRRLSRKLLLLAPVVIFPLMTLLLWSCGILAPLSAGAAAPAGRLNASVPAALTPSDSGWTKLAYYRKAERDSERLRAARNKDPFYGLRATAADLGITPHAPAGAEKERRATEDSPTRKTPLAARSGYAPGKTDPYPLATSRLPGQPDADERATTRELYRKLDALTGMLDSASARPEPLPYPEPTFSAGSGNTPPVPALPAAAVLSAGDIPDPRDGGAGAAADPELEQISEIMDKIMAVQHPERITDSLRRLEQGRLERAFPVSETPRPVTAILNPTGEETLSAAGDRGPETAAAPGASRRFYSLGTATRERGENPSVTLKARVPETQRVSAGSRVMVALAEDMYVKATRIPAGTLLYGEARVAGERMTIRITSLVSEGEIIPVALDVYDLDGMEGIHIPSSATRQSVNASGARAVESAGTGSLDPSLAGRVADAGIRAAQNLFGRKIRQVTVTIPAGYRLLLKDLSGG